MEPAENNPFAPPHAELTVASDWSLSPGQRPVPFEDLEREPRFWPRVWAMFGLLFTEPSQLAERVPVTEGLGAPLRFALLLTTPTMLLCLLLFGLLGGLMSFGMTQAASSNSGPPAWFFLLVGPGYVVMLALMVMITVPLGGLVVHVCLWMWGGTRQGRGLGQSLRAMGYYMGFHMLGSLIPLLNIAVALAGPAFLGMALARIHRTDTWRGVLAAYMPLLLCCCCYALIIFMMIGAGAFK